MLVINETVNALAKFFDVDRSTVQRVVDKAELEPEKASAKQKKYDVSKVARLLLNDRRELGYKEGFKVGTDEANAAHETSDEDIDFESWRYKKAQADKLEIENAERQERLAPLEAIIKRDRIVANAQAQIFDSLPVVLKRKQPSLSDLSIEEIKLLVAKARNEVQLVIEERVKELEDAMERQSDSGADGSLPDQTAEPVE